MNITYFTVFEGRMTVRGITFNVRSRGAFQPNTSVSISISIFYGQFNLGRFVRYVTLTVNFGCNNIPKYMERRLLLF